MSKLAFLIDELRRLKVIGPASDSLSGTIMWQSSYSLLIRLPVDLKLDIRSWVLVYRSSRQYYKVTVLTAVFAKATMLQRAFRNYRLTADYINKFFRR